MSVITCLSWVPRGYAKSQPIQQDMDLDHLEDLKDQQLATDDELDMANYDAEEALPEFTNVEPDADLENLEDEEAEDNKINPEDALILAGVQNGDFSEVHVYIYVEKTSALYVHHDIMLNAYPLSLSWLPYNPKNPGEAGNCVAVSTFQKGIEIWDLDLMDPLEPVVTLGGYKFKEDEALGLNTGKKRKQKKTLKKGSHKDSVLSTALHPTRNNILASGSADCTVKLWDILTQECKFTSNHHSGKVNLVRWHPTEERILATAGLDNQIFLVNADNTDSKVKSIQIKTSLTSDIESMSWDPFNPYSLSVTTENGGLLFFDSRQLSAPVFTVQAHSSQCSLSFSPGVPHLMATGSTDRTIKLWNSQTHSMVLEKSMNVDELFCVEFYKDSPFTLACGGIGGQLAIWDTEENSLISSGFNRAL